MSNDYTPITELAADLLSPDQIHRFVHRYRYAHHLAQNQRVLEVACGAGSALNYLAQHAASVVGVDYTSGVLPHAQRNSRVPLVQGDAQRLPFAANSFSFIFCFEAIYYLENYQDFLQECHRLLTPTGKLLICQSNPDWPYFAPGALTTYYPPLPTLAAMTTAAGFQAAQCFGTLPVTDSARQRAINTARQWITTSGLTPWLGAFKTVLQQLSYGQLHPLPATIDAQWLSEWQTDITLTPLSPTERDRVHRVIYVEAQKA